MKGLLAVLLLSLGASGVLAQNVYKWVDEDGSVHYSQTLPPDRADDAHDRLNSRGLVAERVRAAEELAALKAEQAEQRELDEQQRLQAQQDRLFLAAFPDERDLRRMAESRRETILSERKALGGLIEQSRTRFAELVAEAGAYERRGESTPGFLIQSIEDTRGRLQQLADRRAELDRRLEQLEHELSADLARHRRLTGDSSG